MEEKMPHIEMRGYGAKPIELRNKIRNAVKNLPEATEIVTSICPVIVTDQNDKSTPFLRVISTKYDGLDDLLDRLKTLGEDIEVMPLERWIPKT
jgi:hypothetical protein